MNSENWQKIKKVFNAAVDLEPAERARFLQNQIGASEEILSEVRKLLQAEKEDRFEKPIANISNLTAEKASENYVGKQIGKYKIVRELGQGGMGTVFLADREDLQKQFAVKILKHEFSSKNLLRRFQTEREILARLDHPNIANLLDGGTTSGGSPYLVMEYVEGEDLLVFSKKRNLSIEKKLKVFRKICAAVAYAHGKLVVHRDLKPSNILVTKTGEPKLLDFGISKLIDEDNSSEKGTATALGMMTPNYASPEQFRGESVSTATDVYSLGVILYELLTNALPYEITSKRIDEVARAVIEFNPPKPSEAVVSLFQIPNSNSQTETSRNEKQRTNGNGQNRKLQTANRKSLRGDLDNIILKSLRKESERRYSSVEKFSDDVRRHLEGLPVSARPDTFSYRAEKFIKRNRASVASAALVFLILIFGVIGISWQYVRAERQRKIAEHRFNQVRELANKVVFKYNDGIANLPGSTGVRKMLVDDATEYLDNLAQDAGNDSELLRELANAYIKLADVQGKTYYSNVGDTNGAIENYRKAVEILEKLSNVPNVETRRAAETDLIVAYQTLGMMLSRTFAHADSIAAQRKALALVEAKAALAPDDADVQYLLVRARGRLADSMRESGRFDEAIEIYRSALTLDEAIFRRSPENENVEAALAVLNDRVGRNLALRAIDLKRIDAPPEQYESLFSEAETRMNAMFSGFERLVAAHPEKKKYRRDLSTAYSNLGMLYRETGRLQKSEEMLEEDLQKREVIAAADFADRESQADLSEALAELAQTEAARKNFPVAFGNFNRADAIYDRLIDADRANMEFRRLRFDTENYYADALRQNNDFAKSMEIYQRAFEKLKKDAPADSNPYFDFAEGVINEKFGDVFSRQENFEKAAAAYRKTLELWSQPEAKQTELSRSPERIERVRQKILKLKGSE